MNADFILPSQSIDCCPQTIFEAGWFKIKSFFKFAAIEKIVPVILV